MEEYFLPEGSDTEELLPLVCFRLGSDEYALDITRVHEVLRPAPITLVPQMPDFVLGVINVHGNIIPVFDLHRKFGLGKKTLHDKAKIVVVDTREAPVSFVADELMENIKVERASITTVPHGKLKVPKEYVTGIVRVDERVLVILDWDKIYASAQEDIKNFSL